MARLFLSHSSSDNDLARALRDWLVSEGWDDLFLDFDPERGIRAGERWEKALLDAADRCQAVLFLISRNWLGSGWCLKEFHLAGKLNKRMFMLLLDGLKVSDLPPELSAEWQVVDLGAGADYMAFLVADGVSPNPREVRFSNNGLRRIRAGLNSAGLDPRFFSWPPQHDPDRPPYRGLRALEAEDAGIFFGREAQIIAALDRMRGLREAAPPRFLAILGASGSGKSSLLRAGLLPRLQRDDRHFLPLPVIRAERAVMSGENGLLRALATTFERAGMSISARRIEAMVSAADAPDLMGALRELAETACPPALEEPQTRPPTILLSIDQGEELFLAEGADEAAKFLDLVRTLVASPEINLTVVVAIRSDTYERLQMAPELEGVRQETLSLAPMQRGSYESVIVGPAMRLTQSGRRFVVEPALTQALLTDVETGGAKDALPLLAFTLELLFASHGHAGRLTLADYVALGGIAGSIEVAVERAMASADSDPRIPKDRTQRLALMRRGFIPWLAGVDRASNTVRRRVARMAEVPIEARPLVECLIDSRLLSTDVALDGEVTVEPAHEALLRQWSLLQGWLEEDFASMAALEGVQRAARDWEANLRDPGWLAHSAGRLEDAEASQASENLKGFLRPSEQEYLRECRLAEDAQRDRELKEARRLAESRAQTVRRTRIGLVAALVLATVAGAAGWYATLQREEANRQAVIARAEEQSAKASLAVVKARQALASNEVPLATRRALDGYRTLPNRETRSVLLEIGLAIDPHLEFDIAPIAGESISAISWIGGDGLVIATKTGTTTGLAQLRFKPNATPERSPGWQVPKLMFDAEDEAEIIALAGLSDSTVIAARNNGAIEAYRAEQRIAAWMPPARGSPYAFDRAAISMDGRTVVFGGDNEAAFIHCAPLPASVTALTCTAQDSVGGKATAVAVQPGGEESFVAFSDGTLLINAAAKPARRLSLPIPGSNLRAIAPAGGQLAAILQLPSADGGATKLALLEARGEKLEIRADRGPNLGAVATLAWRRTGSEVVHGCLSREGKPGPLCLNDLTGAPDSVAWSGSTRMIGHTAAADTIAVSADGSRVASRAPAALRIWRWPSDHTIHSTPALSSSGGWASLAPWTSKSLLLLSGRDGMALALDTALDSDQQKQLPSTESGVIDAVKVTDGRVIAHDLKLSFVKDGEADHARTIDLSSSVIPQGGLIWAGAGRVVAVSLTEQRIGLVDFDADPIELLDFSKPDGSFSPFGITVDRGRKHLIVSGTDGRVHLFDLTTRLPIGVLGNQHVTNVAALLGAESLAMSADGGKLATTASGNQVMLYDLNRRSSTALLRTDRADTKSVAFSADGERLAAIDANNAVVVWSLVGSTPERWLDFRLPPSEQNLSNSLPTLQFVAGDKLVILNSGSEVTALSLDPRSWIRRLEQLGYHKTAEPE